MLKAESKFKEKTRKDLKTLKNIWFFKSQEIAVRGIPDWIICLNGFFIAIELKKGLTEKAAKLQEYKIEGIRSAKGVGVIAAPENWDDVFEVLQEIDGGLYDSVKVQGISKPTFFTSSR